MNKTKKILMVLTLACAALFLAQCKKGIIEQPGETPSGETIEVSLNVVEDCSKTGISTTGIVTWKTGDRLHVVGATDGYLGYITAQDSGASAYFTGTIKKPSTTTQDFHFYYTGNQGFTLTNNTNYTYDISTQTGSLANIEANLHLMHGVIPNVDKNTTNFGSISMTCMMSIAKLQFSKTGTLASELACYGAYTTATLNAKTGVLTHGVADVVTLNGVTTTKDGKTKDGKTKDGETVSAEYYLVLVPGSQTLTFANEKHDDVWRSTAMTKDVVSNKFYTSNESDPNCPAVTVALSNELKGVLPEIFSIGTNSKGAKNYVYFSKGNLWYGPKTVGAAATWNLETNQWEYYSSYDFTTWGNNNHISHFYWSNTTDWKTSGMEPYAKTYSYSAQGTSDNFFTEASDFTVEGQNGWYTLSRAEWSYLISNSSHCKRSTVTFVQNGSGVNGLILMPDNWSGTLSSTTNYSTWQTLAAAGAVFLPLSGIRYGSTPNYVSSNGCYWSSNPCGTKDNAYRMYYNMSTDFGTGEAKRHSGNAVRLVKVVH